MALLELRIPTNQDISYSPFVLIGVLGALIYYEIRITEGIIDKIINGKEVKSLFFA